MSKLGFAFLWTFPQAKRAGLISTRPFRIGALKFEAGDSRKALGFDGFVSIRTDVTRPFGHTCNAK
jgi:hypothetical protein